MKAFWFSLGNTIINFVGSKVRLADFVGCLLLLFPPISEIHVLLWKWDWFVQRYSKHFFL